MSMKAPMKRRVFLQLAAKFSITSIGAGLLLSTHANAQGSTTGLVMDDRFMNHLINPTHPESPARYQTIKQRLVQQNINNKTIPIQPISDVEPWLGSIHSKAHINAIKTREPETHNNVLIATAGVLAAVDQVCTAQVGNAFCATRPPGHHALNTGREEGFCYYNHIAIAARYAQQKYHLKKVLIIDWDYHHGNGTEWAFYSDPDVLYFSTHDQYAYPGTGSPDRQGEGLAEGYNINVHLGCGASDQDFIEVFKTRLIPAVDNFKPDLILISAGFDSREKDLLGCHAVTDHGFAKLTEMVMALADQYCHGRIISILEGGYNLDGTADAVVAHIKTMMS